MDEQQIRIGQLTEIRSGRMSAALLAEEDGFRSNVTIDGEQLLVGQVGSHVSIRQNDVHILGMITRSWRDPDHGVRHIDILPLGELSNSGFQRGVRHYPTPDANVFMVNDQELHSLYNSHRALNFDVGQLTTRSQAKVYLDPDPLFGRHLAILGQSGSGKSWAVASLLQRTVQVMPNAHIVLLDLHGEYCWRGDNGKLQGAFDPRIMRYIDARDLEIPYWLLTYSELVDLLIDRNDAGASTQIAFLREVLLTLRRKANTSLNVERLSVDSPVYFSLKDLYQHFKKANEHQLDFGKAKGPLFGQFDEFLVKLQSKLNDARYDFLFRPRRRTNSDTLADLLRDFVGLTEPKRQITVVDLSPVPSDVRPTVSAQLGRLAFEFNYWNPRRREFPILLVCEEAHAYIPRASNSAFEGTRRSMERIAKEGRKYGVGLTVVSQRPHDLSETVLAQCANYICLRLTNPDDQEYVRSLVPEGEGDLVEILSSLGRGEALVLGEATPLPTRFKVYRPNPAPNSQDAEYLNQWTGGPEDLDVEDIVDRWRRQRR